MAGVLSFENKYCRYIIYFLKVSVSVSAGAADATDCDQHMVTGRGFAIACSNNTVIFQIIICFFR